MTLLVSWIVFPLVLGLLALGCGLLVERLGGVRLPGALLLPTGFAAIVVVTQFATLADATAELAAPAVIGLAVVGLGLSLPWSARRVEPAALAAAAGVFAAFAAPIVLSGEATFAGYIKLDDTSTFLALTDRALEHGRSLAGLAPSSYEAALAVNLPGYPLGSLLPLGVGGALVGQDLAWVFQPYLAFLAALLALVLYELVAPLVKSTALRALAVFVAGQPALLYAYSLWGGIKELAAAPMLALVAALTGLAFQHRSSPLSVLPLATAGAAVLGILSLGGAVWLVPVVIVTAALTWRRGVTVKGAAFLASLLALSLPSLAVAGIFLRRDNAATFSSETELGNLVQPLDWLQLFGIWPTGDFRWAPGDLRPTYVLGGLVAAAAAGGVLWALNRWVWELPLYAASATGGCLVFAGLGSPWVGAKALAIASPAFVVAALSGCAAVFARGRRVEALVAALAVAGGVLASNALAYHEVNLAPRDQLAELEHIGKRFAGQGPTLMTEYQPYGVRHFLRNADPEGASELRRRIVPLRDGTSLDKGAFADIDLFQLDALLTYRTLVLRRSPVGSRPPSPYRLVWSRRYYEVWQRPEAAQPSILEHLPLGDRLRAAAKPSCRAVRRLARVAAGGLLAATPSPPTIVVHLSRTRSPRTWEADRRDPSVLYPVEAGTLEADVQVPVSGRYEIWLRGSFRGRLELSVDGTLVKAARQQLNYAGHYTSLGELELSRGWHGMNLHYGGPDLGPGSGGHPWDFGPLVLKRTAANARVSYLAPTDAVRLCGRTLDWVEALAP